MATSVSLSRCRPFELNDLDDYEKHFTVMNYDPDVVLKQVGPGEAREEGSESWPAKAIFKGNVTHQAQVLCPQSPPCGA